MSRKKKLVGRGEETPAQIEAKQIAVNDLRESIEYRKSELRAWFADQRRRHYRIARRELKWGRTNAPHGFIIERSAELRRLKAELAALVG